MLGLACACVLFVASVATAAPVDPATIKDRTEQLPKRLRGIDVEEQLEQRLPLDLAFHDDAGRPVTLRQYFDGKLPVIITLNYSDCPMLCSLQLNGFVESLKAIDWTAGKEFRILTVSLDPKESPETAQRTKQRYLKQYGRPQAASGWHFLTGSDQNIHALANAIGFRYGYNEKRKEYVHPAAIALTTPTATIARYLYGIEYHPKTLRLSLAESSEGKIGSTIDRLILYCFHYDADEGRYAPVARNLMRAGGALAALVLGAFLASFWLNEFRKKRQKVASNSP